MNETFLSVEWTYIFLFKRKGEIGGEEEFKEHLHFLYNRENTPKTFYCFIVDPDLNTGTDQEYSQHNRK